MAKASASHGHGRRRIRSSGSMRTARPMWGSRLKRAWNSRWSSSTLVADRSRRTASQAAVSVRARAAKTTRSPCWTTPQKTHSSPTRTSRWTASPRRAYRPSRRGTRSRNGHGGRTSARSVTKVSPARSRCTSTRNELLPTTSPKGRRFCLRLEASSFEDLRRWASAMVAAPATNPVAASAATWLLPTTAISPAPAGATGDGLDVRDGQSVDDFGFVCLVHAAGVCRTHRTDSVSASWRARCRTRSPTTAR